MKELLGSHIKEKIIMLLGLRGGAPGRSIARRIESSPTPVFKALNQLVRDSIVKFKNDVYYLNRDWLYFEELMSMIFKNQNRGKQQLHYLPKIQNHRKIDPISIYQIAEFRPKGPKSEGLFEALKHNYHA